TGLLRVRNRSPTAWIALDVGPVHNGQCQGQARTDDRSRADRLSPLYILKVREIAEVIAHSGGPHIARPGYTIGEKKIPDVQRERLLASDKVMRVHFPHTWNHELVLRVRDHRT